MTIGKHTRAADWDDRTGGSATYAPDVELEGMLTARIVRSTEARARIKAIDTGAAARVDGVRDVITSADLRPLRYLHMGDGESSSSSDRYPLARGEVRFIGEEIAAVAAVDERSARRGEAAVRVTYRRRQPVLSTWAALEPNAPAVHESTPGNVSATYAVRDGDVDSARKRASAQVKETYTFNQQTHACMETNGITAWFDAKAGRLHVWTPTQSPYFLRKEIAHQLRLEREQIEFHEVAVGGGFGSKSKISEHEICAAVLAVRTGRPVRLYLDRTEEFSTTKPRHRFEMTLETGADASGHLTHRIGDVTVDNGAYNHFGPAVMGYGVGVMASTYRVDAQDISGRLVYTNTQPGGQFRGYGGVQATFAVECQMDELADELGLDPIALRLTNANQSGDVTPAGWHIASTRLTECLERLRTEADWDRKRAELGPGYGIGMSCAMHVTGAMFLDGANSSGAGVDVHRDGRIRIRFAGSDAGTGQRTVLAQIAAAELGVQAADITVEMMKVHDAPVDLGAWSSRGTLMGGNAVRAAAATAAGRLRELAAAKAGGAADAVRLADGAAHLGDESWGFGDLIGLSDDLVEGWLRTDDVFTVEVAEGNVSPSYSFAALAAEVFVDPTTGKVTVLDVVSVHDSGTVINPSAFKSQVVGGVVMGLGAALGEELIHEGGRLVNQSFGDYALPRAADAPRVRVIPLETVDPYGPHGAKGIGEICIVVTPAAVANAVAHATGARLRHLPLTPDKVLGALNPPTQTPSTSWRRPSHWWIHLVRWAYPRGLFAALRLAGRRFARRRSFVDVTAIDAPASVDEAVAALARHGTRAIAGGTDLLPARRQLLVEEDHLVDLTGVRGFGDITEQPDGGLVVGASVTLTQLERHAQEHGDAALRQAIASIASPQVRNTATVAGNLCQLKRCWFFRSGFDCYKRGGSACPCYAVQGDHRFYHAAMDAHRCQAITPSDLATVLVALDATVDARSAGGERRIGAGDLYSGPGEVSLAAGEIITAVTIPADGRRRATNFEKLALWTGDFAVASVATALDLRPNGSVRSARVVVGGVAPTPIRLPDVERVLKGVDLGTADVEALVAQSAWDRDALPLPGNAWKLQAASGLIARSLRSSVVGAAGPSLGDG